jgi:hypothetical protein
MSYFGSGRCFRSLTLSASNGCGQVSLRRNEPDDRNAPLHFAAMEISRLIVASLK